MRLPEAFLAAGTSPLRRRTDAVEVSRAGRAMAASGLRSTPLAGLGQKAYWASLPHQRL